MIGYIKTALGASALLIVFGFYSYVGNMRMQLDEGIRQQERSTMVIEDLQASVTNIKVELSRAAALIKEVDSSRRQSKAKLDNIEAVLAKHNISNIRAKKPELLRRIYEKGVNKYYDDMEETM